MFFFSRRFWPTFFGAASPPPSAPLLCLSATFFIVALHEMVDTNTVYNLIENSWSTSKTNC